MKLKEYLDVKGKRYDKFAEELGVSKGTLSNIFNGLDITHSLALLIVRRTDGEVSHEDLTPEGFSYLRNFEENKKRMKKRIQHKSN